MIKITSMPFLQCKQLFCPKANVHIEKHKFHQLMQTREKIIDEFVSRFRQGTGTSEFCNSAHERIRDQIVKFS